MTDFMRLLAMQNQPRSFGDVLAETGSAVAGQLAGGPQVGETLARGRAQRAQISQANTQQMIQLSQLVQQQAQAEAARGNVFASTMLKALEPFKNSSRYAELVSQAAIELEPLEDTASPTEVIAKVGQVATNIGIQPAGQRTERDKKLSQYIARGLPPEKAMDIVDKNIVVNVDNTGMVSLFNRADGTIEFVLPEIGLAAGADAQKIEEPKLPKEDTVFGSISQLGAVPAGKEVLSRTVGQFVEGVDFPEVTRARATIRSIRDQIIAAYSTTNRPPIIQQQRILENFPSLGPAENPARAFELLSVTHDQLTKQFEADMESTRDPTLDPTVKREHQRRALAIRDVLAQMGDPSDFKVEDLPKVDFKELFNLIPSTETGEDISAMSDEQLKRFLGIE